MQANLFIIHGINGDTSQTFGPYVEEEANKLGLMTYCPAFPIYEDATFESWSKVLDLYYEKGLIHNNTIIIAHSIGSHFIPKYLVEKKLSIKLYISLAGFVSEHSGREDLSRILARFDFIDGELEDFISLAKERYAIYSDNDHINPKEELERYADSIKAHPFFIPGIGHMGRKSGIKEIPEIADILKKYV